MQDTSNIDARYIRSTPFVSALTVRDLVYRTRCKLRPTSFICGIESEKCCKRSMQDASNMFIGWAIALLAYDFTVKHKRENYMTAVSMYKFATRGGFLLKSSSPACPTCEIDEN